MNDAPTTTQPSTPYAILGDDGVSNLVDAFYDAMDELSQAQEIRAMHAADLAPIRLKLKRYLTGWLGGPPIYRAIEGTVCLTDSHAAFHIGPRQRDQWLDCMEVALERIEASAELKAMLKQPLQQIANAVSNQASSDPQPRAANIIASG